MQTTPMQPQLIIKSNFIKKSNKKKKILIKEKEKIEDIRQCVNI